MEATRSELVAELVEQALELEPAARINFLDRECGDDTAVRREVESLLKFQSQAQRFIEESAFATAAETLLDTAGELKPGDALGDYTIKSLLGEGGMGEVYLADDRELGRTVAIKLIKHAFSRASFLRQFRQEERILAGLTHPNIARLYGGAVTPDGLPYFAMEYVEGERLDSYCTLHQPSIRARLEMFQKICAAVSYAHQRLVIHRDLKPGNIRVTPEGEPKLLDFGIAKLIDEQNEDAHGATITLAGVMTPEYASPEQMRGEAMTTASDVYSLGVILYELLTGEKPYRLTSRRPDAISRAITESVPTRPSAIGQHKSLRGDLDNIVLMAMRKEPERRYASVGQFSSDIARHLAGRPVLARKDTWTYRSGKFIRRHKVGVIAALLLALSLVTGILTTSWEARRAEKQRALAQHRFDDVRRIAHSLIFEVHDAIENLPGSTTARELLINRALEYLDRLAGESSGDAGLERELVAAYLKVGNVQGNPTNPNLGDSSGALNSYAKAQAITEKLLARSNESDLRNLLAMILRKVADVQAHTGRVADGVRTAQRSVQIFRELAEAAPDRPGAQMDLAIGELKLGDILGNPNFDNLSDQAGAMRSYDDALRILSALEAQNPRDAKTRRYLGIIHERIGTMRELQNDVALALSEYQSSAAIRVPLAAEFPNDSQMVRDAAIAHEKMANVQTTAGQLNEALQSRRRSLEIFEHLASADPKNVLAQQSLGISCMHLGELLATMNSREESIGTFQRAADVLSKNSEPSDSLIYGHLQNIREQLAKLQSPPRGN